MYGCLCMVVLGTMVIGPGARVTWLDPGTGPKWAEVLELGPKKVHSGTELDPTRAGFSTHPAKQLSYIQTNSR